MNKRLPLVTAIFLLLQTPAWGDNMAAHAGHDMAPMQADDANKEGMQDGSHGHVSPQAIPDTHGQHAAPSAAASPPKAMQEETSHKMPATSDVDHRQTQDEAQHTGQHDAMPGMSTEMQPTKAPARGAGNASHTLPSTDSEAGMAAMQGGAAPPDARDANAYSDGYDFGPIAPPHMGDRHNFGALFADKLEAVRANGHTTAAYDVKAWFGRDYDRAVLKAEGDINAGRLQDARTEILWGHAIAAFWDLQSGLRYDSGAGPGRGWLAFGVEGLAPYWFDLEATAYIGNDSRTALRLAASHDILFTQKLILKPQIEANFYGSEDGAHGRGEGLSDIKTGLRLRYEFRRQFAPYLGLEWHNKFGGTADYARLAGEKSAEARVVAGVQFWF